MVRVDKETERGEPGGCEDQVHWPSVEGPAEGKQVQQAEEDGDASDHDGEDESFDGPTGSMSEEGEVGPDDADDHLDACQSLIS